MRTLASLKLCIPVGFPSWASQLGIRCAFAIVFPELRWPVAKELNPTSPNGANECDLSPPRPEATGLRVHILPDAMLMSPNPPRHNNFISVYTPPRHDDACGRIFSELLLMSADLPRHYVRHSCVCACEPVCASMCVYVRVCARVSVSYVLGCARVCLCACLCVCTLVAQSLAQALFSVAITPALVSSSSGKRPSAFYTWRRIRRTSKAANGAGLLLQTNPASVPCAA